MVATQWNASKPALANQISADVPDIEENFEEIKRILDVITNGTVGTTDTDNYKVKIMGDDDNNTLIQVEESADENIIRFDTAGTERAVITAAGEVLIGDATARATGGVTASFQVNGTAGADSTITIYRGSADASGPALFFGKGRDALGTYTTAVSDNDVLGSIIFHAADTGDLVTPGASIIARVNGTPGANDMPTELVFSTTADGANSVSERVCITAAGLVGIGEAAPDEMLHLTSATATKPIILLENTNADADGAVLKFNKNSASPADNDVLGEIYAYGDDSGGTSTLFTQVDLMASDVTNTDEAGRFRVRTMVDSVMRTMFDINGYNGTVGQGEIVFNEDSIDMNFRVETDTEANALFIEGSSGTVYINDSANAIMTGPGLTINQGTGTDEILAFKGSNIAHGVTGFTETDTFFAIGQRTGDVGGITMRAIAEATNDSAIYIHGICGTAVTTEATNSLGCYIVDSSDISGAADQSWGADDNTHCWQNNNATQMILKGDGELWTNLAASVFDEYDDAIAVHDLNKVYLANEQQEFIKYNRESLISMGVISEGNFMSHQMMMALHTGAISEMFKVVSALCNKIGITYDEAKLLPI